MQKQGVEQEPVVDVTLVHRGPAVLFLILAALQLMMPARIWLAGLAGLGGMLFLAYLWASQLARNLAAKRRVRFDHLQVGDAFEEQFELTNTGILPALWVEMRDRSNFPGYSASTVRAVSAYGVTRWRSMGNCTLRGEFSVGPWELHTADPFGMFAVRRRFVATQQIVVYPPIARMPWAPPLSGNASGKHQVRRRGGDPAAYARTIRDYQNGDPLNVIHWRSTARHGALQVRELEKERAGETWILPDLDSAVHVGEGSESTLEYAIILAASLAAELSRQCLPLGIWAYGPDPCILAPLTGMGRLTQILHFLAVAKPDDRSLTTTLETMIHSWRGRRTSVLIITTSAQRGWMRYVPELLRRGIQVGAMLLDVTSFEAAGEGRAGLEPDAAQSVLAIQGVHAQIVRRGDLGELRTIAGRAPARWAFKTTGTGRAVAVNRPQGRGVL